MEWTIGNKHCKLFAKCFRCLSQIGAEVNCEWKNKSLFLKTLNTSHAAFVVLRINENFFDSIRGFTDSDYDELGNPLRRKLNKPNDTIRWQVILKACCAAFRGISEVDFCRMKADDSAQRLVFEMLCRRNIKKTYRVMHIDCTSIDAKYCRTLPYRFSLSPRSVLDFLGSVQPGISEITVVLSEALFILKTYHEGRTNLNKRDVHSEFCIRDFTGAIFPPSQVCLTVNLKDLKHILKLCDTQQFTSPTFSFSVPGRPIVVSATTSSPIIMELEAVLATLIPENEQSSEDGTQHSEAQSVRSETSAGQLPTPKRTRISQDSSKNLTYSRDVSIASLNIGTPESKDYSPKESEKKKRSFSPQTFSNPFINRMDDETNYESNDVPEIASYEKGETRLYFGDIPFRREDDEEHSLSHSEQEVPSSFV